MCALLPAWMCLLLGLLPLEVQSRALTLQSLPHRPRASKYPKSINTAIMPPASDLSAAVDDHITEGDGHVIWRALLHKEPPPRWSGALLDQRDMVLWEAPVWQHGSRGRRHANGGGGRGHGHLMRVGCVLGTCQVQNLSHRLYQLIGQSGREDSAPINPRSPHSYG
ncbi:protein ADM2 [Pseudoliparis swirei]|uniref:protein ADM2 n=1 Tax=Pseudoliparis swirei TaxID=2059687 RepID=UPI0024BDD85E|nr:protein ADM2 [Pseudoliparis swirei]